MPTFADGGDCIARSLSRLAGRHYLRIVQLCCSGSFTRGPPHELPRRAAHRLNARHAGPAGADLSVPRSRGARPAQRPIVDMVERELYRHIGVDARQFRHDRSVDDPQTIDAANTQSRGHETAWRAARAYGPGRRRSTTDRAGSESCIIGIEGQVAADPASICGIALRSYATYRKDLGSNIWMPLLPSTS